MFPKGTMFLAISFRHRLLSMPHIRHDSKLQNTTSIEFLALLKRSPCLSFEAQLSFFRLVIAADPKKSFLFRHRFQNDT